MKNRNYKVGLFSLWTLIISATGSTNNPACIPLKYRKPIVDKPDILVVQYIDQAFNGLMWFNGICRMDSSNENATLVTNPRSLQKNLYTFDSYTRVLYEGHNHDVKKVLLDVDDDKYPVYKFLAKPQEEGKTLESVALDWVTKNLYVASRKFVKLVNLLDISKPVKIVHTFKNTSFYPIVKVFPNEAFLIVKTSHGVITRFDLNGANPFVLYNNTEVRIEALALDYYSHYIYWVEKDSVGKTQIRHTTLNGDKAKTLKLDESYQNSGVASNLALDQKYVYYVRKTGDSKYSMFRAGRISGEVDTNFEITNSDSVYGNGAFKYIMVLSGEPQDIVEDHPCQNDNGGCAGYCFAIRNKSKKLTRKCDNKELSVFKLIGNWI